MSRPFCHHQVCTVTVGCTALTDINIQMEIQHSMTLRYSIYHIFTLLKCMQVSYCVQEMGTEKKETL
jgi:hypothetical protein